MADVAVFVNWAKVAAYLGAGLCMGIGAIGPSLGQGMIGASACEAISKNPDSAQAVRSSMFMSLAMAESSSVYCLIISALLIFVK